MLIGLALLLLPAGAGAIESEEYLLKAVFLERFARFIEWPDQAPDSNELPFVIGLIGDNPFGTTLQEVYSSQTVKGRPVEIRRVSLGTVEEMAACQIIFLAGLDDDQLAQVLQVTTGRPILTVGDTAGYGQQGVLINFFIRDERLRFEINERAVRASGLEMSFLLLNVAEIVASPASPTPGPEQP